MQTVCKHPARCDYSSRTNHLYGRHRLSQRMRIVAQIHLAFSTFFTLGHSIANFFGKLFSGTFGHFFVLNIARIAKDGQGHSECSVPGVIWRRSYVISAWKLSSLTFLFQMLYPPCEQLLLPYPLKYDNFLPTFPEAI